MHLLTDAHGKFDGPCVFTLGMFDGVHTAHARLLRRAKRTALQKGLPLVVMTFRKNPLEILAPEHAPRAIQTDDAKLASLVAAGVDTTVLRTFDNSFAHIESSEIIDYIVKTYHPTDWFVGYNNTFGRYGAGTPDILREAGRRLGFKTHVMPALIYEGEAVSSSRIRAALYSGNMPLVVSLLGRAYSIRGYVDRSGVLVVSDRLALPAPGSYNISVSGAAYTLRLIPRRIGPPGPPTDAYIPVGRVVLPDGQPAPMGMKWIVFGGN
ncbi:hypothetical protein AGMMS49992_04690 [Clostridia bacterium]|nr:hypothetical protein AGMMS49992_04690 [Clostridia bacterium]